MVRAAGSKDAQLFRPFTIRELKSICVVRIVGDNRSVGRHCTAKRRQDLRSELASICQRFKLNATEHSALFPPMFENEFAHLVDCADAIQITFAMRIAPREQAVAR